MKKWHRKLLVRGGIAVLAFLVLLVTSSLVVREWAISKAAQDFPPPGRVVEADGRLSHIFCKGSGSPVIVLEAGLEERASQSWVAIHDELSEVSRACAYDRAGLMWSEPGAQPRDARQITGELKALLSVATEPPPYVMVGHSAGGLLTRVYDQRYPGEVAGFVFLDATHPEQTDRWPAEVREHFSPEPLPRWPLWLFTPFRAFLDDRPTAQAAYFWRGALGQQEEVAALNLTMEQAATTGSLGDRPVLVLTAGRSAQLQGVSESGNAQMRRVWLELQAELAALSTNSVHHVVPEAGHDVHGDAPDVVVAGIRRVVEAVRQLTDLAPAEPSR